MGKSITSAVMEALGQYDGSTKKENILKKKKNFSIQALYPVLWQKFWVKKEDRDEGETVPSILGPRIWK